MSLHHHSIEKNLRYNMALNILEGAFFGLGLGFASFVTIIPLFVSELTDSPILIGLVPAMHSTGWYLPQLFTARLLARLGYFKSTVMRYTVHERLPFLGLAVVAWMSVYLDEAVILVLVFSLLVWQGLGAGFTANPWQNLVSKLIPDRIHGVFFGAQFGAVSIFMVAGSLLTGILLDRYALPYNFSLVFFFASIALAISMAMLMMVREPHIAPAASDQDGISFGSQLITILKNDRHFRKFLLVRSLMQLGIMPVGFYTVYTVQSHGAPGSAIGVMTAIMSVTQVFANVLLGRLGDHRSHQLVLKIGAVALALSAWVAWLAPDFTWFYLAFMLAGIAYVTVWATQMIVTLQFARNDQRPAYIGLSNTITAPSALLAPVLGGWLAGRAGYPATFWIAVISAIFTLIMLQTMNSWNPSHLETNSA